MNIQDLGSIGELVAAIATLGTLVFLGMQIRQNTQAVRSSSFQSANFEIVKLLQIPPEVAEILEKDHSELSDSDRQIHFSRLASFFSLYEVMYYQNLKGGVEPAIWTSRVEQMKLWLNVYQDTEFWVERKVWYSKPFSEFVDHLEKEVRSKA